MGTLEEKVSREGLLRQFQPNTKKNAVKEIMVMWGEGIARNDTAEFDEIMGWLAASTPTRGGKRPLEDTAVAAEEDCFAAADGDTAVAASLCFDADSAC